MSVIVNFYLETPVLRRALRDVPEMAVSVEQQTATETTPTTMIFWASGGDFGIFDDGLAADPTVAESTVLTEMDDARLYRTRLTDYGEELLTYRCWADMGAMFQSSERSGDGWRSQMWFPDRESVQRYAQFCREHDLTFELDRLYSTDGGTENEYGLTNLQRETLLTAVEAGYYSIPREASADALADRLDVSHQAVSERLRRGTETLIRETIGATENGATSDRTQLPE